MTADASTTLPLVAVVTPVYNGARFLADVMESVQAQTYANVVHILLDNASTDSTPQIIESFRGRRIPLVVRRNETLLPAHENWNAALQLIPEDAAYFRILCADDSLFPEATERMVALAESDPEIAVVSTAILRNGKEEDFRWPKDRSVFAGKEALQRCFTMQGGIEARQSIMRREALASATPFFDIATGHFFDLDALLRVFQHRKFGYLHEPLCLVREHEANQSAVATQPLRHRYRDWLVLMRRYGPFALGEDYEALERRYRRYYFRRMLRWRLQRDYRRVFDFHMQQLNSLGSRPTLFDFGDAALDYVFEKLGFRAPWYGYPY